MSRGDEEYRTLSAALATIDAPECSGDPRFLLEAHEIAADELSHLSNTICRPCPLRDLCRAYGAIARPPAGIWGGRVYKAPKERKPR